MQRILILIIILFSAFVLFAVLMRTALADSYSYKVTATVPGLTVIQGTNTVQGTTYNPQKAGLNE